MGEEKYARPAVSRDGGVGKWLIGKWLTSTSTTARRQPQASLPLATTLSTVYYRVVKTTLDLEPVEGNVFRRTCLAASVEAPQGLAVRGLCKTERDGEGSADGAEGGAGW